MNSLRGDNKLIPNERGWFVLRLSYTTRNDGGHFWLCGFDREIWGSHDPALNSQLGKGCIHKIYSRSVGVVSTFKACKVLQWRAFSETNIKSNVDRIRYLKILANQNCHELFILVSLRPPEPTFNRRAYVSIIF